MHIDEFLARLVVLLGSAVAVLLVSYRLRVPPVIGLLLTGVLVGPTGLGFISDPGRSSWPPRSASSSCSS